MLERTTRVPPRRARRRALLNARFPIALALAACRVGPEHAPVDLSERLAPDWRQTADATGPLTAAAPELEHWWTQLGAPELDTLVQRLLRDNLSLAEAAERALQARARLGSSAAARLPTLDGEARYLRAGTGDEALNFQGPPPGREVDLFSLGTSAAWELDLWGRVARRVEAAEAGVAIAVEDWRGVAVSLVADLGVAWLDAWSANRRAAVLAELVAVQRDTLELARARAAAGTGTEFDVALAERELRTSQARLPELQRARRAAENRVALLIGARPADGLVTTDATPTLPPAIGIGIPAALLDRRADVRRAERALERAIAEVGAAAAERYPRITLLGSLALQTPEAGDLLGGRDALAWSIGPSLTVPLFDGGRIDAEVAFREAQVREARLAFERTVLEAIAEVETTATGVVRTRERVAALQQAAQLAERSATLARQRYTAGSVDLSPVLDATRARLAVADDLAVATRDALVATVDLYRALGGGFGPVGRDVAVAAPAEVTR